MTLHTKIICTYIYLMPFLSAFALIPILPVPLIFIISSVFISALIGNTLKKFLVKKTDLLVILTIVSGIFGMVFSWEYLGLRNINHALAFSTAFFFFYLVVRNFIIKADLSWYTLGKVAANTIFLLSWVIAFEFVTANFFGFYLSDVIPYGHSDLTNADVLESFKRPRGLAVEPGFTAILYELLLPLSLVYLRFHKLLFWIFIPIFLTGYLLLFSAASMFSFLVSLLILLLVRRNIKYFFVLLSLTVIAILIYQGSDLMQWAFYQVIGRKGELLTSGASPDLDDYGNRNSVLQTTLLFLNASPLGVGWGTISQLSDTNSAYRNLPIWPNKGMISLYADISVAGGVFGILAFWGFQYLKFAQILKIKSFESNASLVSFIACSTHHVFVSEMWFPMIWFAFALSDFVVHKKRNPTVR